MSENYLKKELYDLIKVDSKIFDFIQSGSLDGIWYWDLKNTENEWMSPKFWETLGYDPNAKKHLASEWQDIIFKEDLEVALENFKNHCEDETHPYDQIVRYRHKNGSIVWIRCRGLAIRDKEGNAIRMLGAHTDITKLKKAEKDIKELSDEYEKIFNGTQDAMFLIEVVGKNEFKYVRNNLSHQKKTKIALEQLRNKTPEELLGEELGGIVSSNYQKCIDNNDTITYEENLTLSNISRIWLTTLTPIKKEDKTYIVGSSKDITERKMLEMKLEKSANYDKLTKIPNRRFLFKQLEEMLHNYSVDKDQFALIFIDLDGFKAVNDNYGHETGDQVLITVANRLQDIINDDDIVARIGGDEFIIILPNIRNEEDIKTVVNKINLSLKESMYINNNNCNIDSSIGVAVYPKDGTDSDTLIRNADYAMYSIKKNGKGGYEFYS